MSRRRFLTAALAAILAMAQAGPLLAAISATAAWEVRTTGSDTACSGGFRGGSYIAAPSAPTVTGAGTGGTVAAATYYVVVTATDGLGDTVISGETAVTVSGATASFTITGVGAYAGALTWNAYCGTTTGGPYFPQGTSLALGSNRVVTTTPPTSGTQPRGVDYTLQNGAQLDIDNSIVTCTTTGANSNTLTFTLGHIPVGAEVGNTFRALTGTNVNAGVYEITAVTTTTWTVTGAQNLTTAGGAGSAITGKMGGCFASPGQAGAFSVSGNTIYVKAGTYTIGAGTADTAGNKVSLSQQNLVGYGTNRNLYNTDTPPVLDAGGNSYTMVNQTGNFGMAANLSVTNSTGKTAVNAFVPSTGQICRRLAISGVASTYNSAGNNSYFIDCSDSGCGGMTSIGSGTIFVRYVSTAGTGALAGINTGAFSRLEGCLVVGQSGATSIGIQTGGTSVVSNCVVASSASGAGRGIFFNGFNCVAENCIVSGLSGPGGIGYQTNATSFHQYFNCADYNCETAYTPAVVAAICKANCVHLTADPFTNASGGDFSLNSTAGGGALCRNAGIPGTLPGLSTTGHRSIGAAEPAAAAGGGFVPGPIRLNSFTPAPPAPGRIKRKAA